MTTVRSAKNKGVRHQNMIRDKIIETFPELEGEVSTALMGENGQDIKLTGKAEGVFPFSVEAKAHKIGFAKCYKALEQANSNCGDLTPIAIVKQDRKKPLVIMDLDDFLTVIK